MVILRLSSRSLRWYAPSTPLTACASAISATCRSTPSSAAPAPERRSESVNRTVDTATPEDVQQHGVGHRLAASRQEHEVRIAETLPGFREDFEGSIRQRDSVRLAGLHPLSGNLPRHSAEVDVAPACAPNFGRARRREYEKLDGEPGTSGPGGHTHLGQRRSDFTVRERSVVLGPTVLRERRTDGVTSRIIRSEALRDRPLHDRADPLADGLCETSDCRARAGRGPGRWHAECRVPWPWLRRASRRDSFPARGS